MIPAFASFLACLSPACAASEDVVHVKVPGQPVEISLDAPGFTAKDDPRDPDLAIVFGAIGEDPPDSRSTLALGAIGRDVWVWIDWQENFPAVAGQTLVKRFGRVPGLAPFSVQDTACFEFRLGRKGAVLQTLFEAYPETQDFVFEIRVVVENITADDLMSGKKNVAKFSREDFSNLVRSFRVAGAPDRAAMSLPAEAYAFRDEAAKSGSDPTGWTSKQCAARADEWSPQLYLGMSARLDDRPELAGSGFARASEILEARKDRDAKLDFALALSVRGNAWVQMRKKSWAAAVPLQQRVLELAKPGAAGPLRGLRADAAFDLACCYAQTQQPAKATESLKLALQERPGWKSRAAEEDLLKSLRKSKEFEALVKK